MYSLLSSISRNFCLILNTSNDFFPQVTPNYIFFVLQGNVDFFSFFFFPSGMYFTAVLSIFCSNYSNGSWTSICEEFCYAKHSVIDIRVQFKNRVVSLSTFVLTCNLLSEMQITAAEYTVLCMTVYKVFMFEKGGYCWKCLLLFSSENDLSTVTLWKVQLF